jgi:hypothetical protein
MTAFHRTGSGRIAAFAMAAMLAGCVAQPPAPVIERPASAPNAAPSAVASGDSDRTDVARVPAEPAGPVIDAPAPEKLIGMGRAEVVKILGPPSFRRLDAPALLMRYRDERCILDLFLYPPAGPRGADGPAVEHVEARAVGGGRMATNACIESVMKSRAARAPG